VWLLWRPISCLVPCQERDCRQWKASRMHKQWNLTRLPQSGSEMALMPWEATCTEIVYNATTDFRVGYDCSSTAKSANSSVWFVGPGFGWDDALLSIHVLQSCTNIPRISSWSWLGHTGHYMYSFLSTPLPHVCRTPQHDACFHVHMATTGRQESIFRAQLVLEGIQIDGECGTLCTSVSINRATVNTW
jgi:hypothetical protein